MICGFSHVEVSRGSGDVGCLRLFRRYHQDGNQLDDLFPPVTLNRQQFQLLLSQKEDILSTLEPEYVSVPNTYCNEFILDDCVHFVALAQLNRLKKEGCPGCWTSSLETDTDPLWFVSHSEQRGGCLMGQNQTLNTYGKHIAVKYLDIFHIFHKIIRLNNRVSDVSREDVRTKLQNYELDRWRLLELDQGVANIVICQQMCHILKNLKF